MFSSQGKEGWEYIFLLRGDNEEPSVPGCGMLCITKLRSVAEPVLPASPCETEMAREGYFCADELGVK